MPHFGRLSVSEILCNEHRGRLLSAFVAGYFALIACSHYWQSSGIMLLCIFALPGILYQVVYSQLNPPKSKLLWCLFVLTSVIIYLIFTMCSLFARNGMGAAEIVVVTLLTIFAMTQIRFLLRVRRQMRQSLVELGHWT